MVRTVCSQAPLVIPEAGRYALICISRAQSRFPIQIPSQRAILSHTAADKVALSALTVTNHGCRGKDQGGLPGGSAHYAEE